MKKRNYSAFTLVEMLIVMGIMIILMAAGIAGGQYAMRMAAETEKDAAVGDLEAGLTAYFANARVFPQPGDMGALVDDYLSDYIQDFDGGTRSNFYYWTDNSQQSFLVCAQYTEDDEDGGVCRGNLSAAIEATRFDDLAYSVDDWSNITQDQDSGSEGNWEAVDTWDPEADGGAGSF